MPNAQLNLYKLSNGHCQDQGYDYFDSMIVCAWSEEEAKTIHPYKGAGMFTAEGLDTSEAWCDRSGVQVELIGLAINQTKGVVLASYHNA